MKAPDKIYTDNRGVYAELPIFSQADANVEYIRKDVLLKWAKENQKDAGPFTTACYQVFIDKLNEM